jgi:hypothetical protein
LHFLDQRKNPRKPTSLTLQALTPGEFWFCGRVSIMYPALENSSVLDPDNDHGNNFRDGAEEFQRAIPLLFYIPLKLFRNHSRLTQKPVCRDPVLRHAYG